MYDYVPNVVAPNPPILVVCHYWGGTAADVFAEASNGGLVSAADTYGFIMVFPQTSNAGWDANSTASLTHNGGGDTEGVAEMVEYAISTYHADPNRVYVTGASSGAMMAESAPRHLSQRFHGRRGVLGRTGWGLVCRQPKPGWVVRRGRYRSSYEYPTGMGKHRSRHVPGIFGTSPPR